MSRIFSRFSAYDRRGATKLELVIAMSAALMFGLIGFIVYSLIRILSSL